MKIKKASNFMFFLLRCVFKPFLFFKYRMRYKKETLKGIKRPCIIIANHSSFPDQFIVGSAFRFGINFVGSDSMFRAGIKSKLMQLIARPIPIKKGSADAETVMNIIRVINSKGAVALFPEGNRTFYGETCYIKPTIGRLAKKLNVPLVMFKIVGGYNAHARWMHKVSKGRMSAYVSRVVTPSELEALTDEQINDIIAAELKFNEFEYNENAQIRFKGKHKAEFLETVLFSCANCTTLGSLYSEGNDFTCSHCGASVRINEYGFFDKINNAENVPNNILDYSRRQIEIVENIDYSLYSTEPMFLDSDISLYEMEFAKKNEFILKGQLKLFNDRLTIGEKEFKLDDITDFAMQGVYKLQIYTSDNKAYLVQTNNMRVSLMKYMICSYAIKKTFKNGERYYGY